MQKDEQKSILLIEDDISLRELVQQLLELEGYKVVTAENGRVGLNLLEKNLAPNLILMDLMMPDLNGWQFIEIKKTIENIREIPVIAFSAYDEHQIKKIEVQAFVKKPIKIDFLLKTIISLIG